MILAKPKYYYSIAKIARIIDIYLNNHIQMTTTTYYYKKTFSRNSLENSLEESPICNESAAKCRHSFLCVS